MNEFIFSKVMLAITRYWLIYDDVEPEEEYADQLFI